MALPPMGSPGPATLSLAAVGAAYGARRELSCLAGITAWTTAVLFVAATGISSAIFAIPSAGLVVFALGSTYMLYLAWRIATVAPVANRNLDSDSPSFSGDLLLALSNPHAYAAIGTACSSHHLVADNTVLDATAKVGALFAVIVVFNVLWLGFGGVLFGLLSNSRSSRIVNVGFAVLLVVSMIFVMTRIIPGHPECCTAFDG